MYAFAYPQEAPSLGWGSFSPFAVAHSVYFLVHASSLGWRLCRPASYQANGVAIAPTGASLPSGSSSSGLPTEGATKRIFSKRPNGRACFTNAIDWAPHTELKRPSAPDCSSAVMYELWSVSPSFGQFSWTNSTSGLSFFR